MAARGRRRPALLFVPLSQAACSLPGPGLLAGRECTNPSRAPRGACAGPSARARARQPHFSSRRPVFTQRRSHRRALIWRCTSSPGSWARPVGRRGRARLVVSCARAGHRPRAVALAHAPQSLHPAVHRGCRTPCARSVGRWTSAELSACLHQLAQPQHAAVRRAAHWLAARLEVAQLQPDGCLHARLRSYEAPAG